MNFIGLSAPFGIFNILKNALKCVYSLESAGFASPKPIIHFPVMAAPAPIHQGKEGKFS